MAQVDTPKVLTRDEAIDLVRRYKQVISHRFKEEPQVFMFGSYSKGVPTPWSDIDVAVVVPTLRGEDWLEQSANLWHDVQGVSLLIEPVLMASDEQTILYQDVLKTGIAV